MDLSRNQITDFTITNRTNKLGSIASIHHPLERIILENNQLKGLNLAVVRLPALIELSLEENSLRWLPKPQLWRCFKLQVFWIL